MTNVRFAKTFVLLALAMLSMHARIAMAFFPPPAPFWLLNTYLEKKSIGRFEPSPLPSNFVPAGPCPTFGQKCSIDFSTLPSSIKGIGVNLPSPFDTSVTLGQAVPQGQLQIWLTELRDLEISNLVINSSSVSSSRERVSIFVDRVKLSLQTELQFANLLIPGGTGLEINSIQVTTNVNKTLQPKGTNVSLSVFVDAPQGKTFANALPSDISLDSCNLQLDLGLTVKLVSGFPFQGSASALINFVIGIVQPILGYVICNLIIEQTFTTVNGQPGIIRAILNNVTSAVNEYSTLPDPNIIAQEQALVNALTFDQRHAEKFSLRNSSFVRATSDVIADWLSVGNPPGVNEVVNAITDSTTGTLVLSNLTRFNVSLEIPLPPFYVGIELLNATIVGLNTFLPNGFAVLANTTIGDFTFGNRFKLSRLGVAFNANIRLRDNFAGDGVDDGWIFNRNVGSPSSTSFLLTYNVSLADIDFEAWVTFITDVTQLFDLQFGQILGKSAGDTTAFQQLIAAGKCAAPFMYGLALPSLTLALGDINVPNFAMSPIDVGITKLVDDVTKMGLKLLESGIQVNLPDVLQHFVRPLLNDFARQAFVSGGILAACPDYVSEGVRVYPNFLTSSIFEFASNIVNNVIGGNPVPNNAASVNEVIRLLIETLIQTFNFPGSSPVPGQWLFLPDFRIFPGKSFLGDQPSFRKSQINLEYLKFYGIDTVQKLLLNTLPSNPNGMDLDFEMRSIGLELRSFWTADYTIVPNFPGRANFVDELFVVNVTLSGLKIRAKPVLEYDLNELYLLKVGDALNLWCLLAPLIRGDLDLQMSITDVQVRVINTTQPNSVPGNELQEALHKVAAEVNPNLENMVNYILKSAANFARNFLRGNLPDFVQVNRETCVDLPNPFNTVGARVVSRVLTSNFTQLALNGLGHQPDPLFPEAADDLVVVPFFKTIWDFRTSFFVPIVNDFVTRLEQADLLKFLQTLGNSTSKDILSDIFETDPIDGSVGIDANLTDILGPDGFPLDFAIENATIHFQSLKLSRISNLNMSSIKVINPVSKFVTETFLAFPGTMKFSFAFAIKFPQNFKNPADPNDQFITENFYVEFDLVDLIIDFQLLTALDLKAISELSIGNFITVNNETLEFGINFNFINCFFGLFFENGLFFPKLLVSLQTSLPLLDISPNVVISAGTEATLLAMVRMLFDFYILDFADITQGFIRTFVNDFILLPNVQDPGVCKRPIVPVLDESSRLFNFLTNPSAAFINNLTTNYLAGEDGSYSLFNTILETAFQATNFFPFQPNEPRQTLGLSNLSLVYNKEQIALVNASITDISLRGAGTFTGLNLVQARSNTTFFNELALTGPASIEFTIRYSIDKLFNERMADDLRIKFGISNVSMAALVELQLAIPELFVMPVGGLTNISQIACIFTAVERLRVLEPHLTFKNFFAQVSCAGVCNSPLLKDLQAGGTISTNNYDSVASLAVYIPGIIALVKGAIDSEQFKEFVDGFFLSPENSCRVALNLAPLVEVINAENPPEFAVSIICALMVSGMVAGCIVLAPLSIPRHYHLKTKLIAEHLRQANDQPNANAQSVAKYMAKMEREALAMAWHPAVSRWAKVVIFVVPIVNIIFLALSFLVYEAFTIDASVHLLGNESKKVPLVPLTIGLLIDKLWNSGSFLLGIGLVVLSGIWPVVKNILLLFLFFAPKWLLFPERRRFMMTVMDVLGKYSFIEAFVVVLLAASLRFEVLVSEVPVLQSIELPDELLVINVLVTVEGGMVILCVAAMATLALNQFMIWQHEKAAFADRRLFALIDGKEDLMLTSRSEVKFRSSDYIFSTKFISPKFHVLTPVIGASTAAPPQGGMAEFQGVNDHYSPRMQNLVILATGFSMLVLLIGQVTPFFSVHYDGLIGLVLGLAIEGGRVRTFTLMDLGYQVQLLTDGTALTNFKLFFFQFLWYVSIIVAPHLQLVLHLVVWMVPMTLANAKTVYFFAKVMGYWASVEVFAIAIIAVTIEIDRIVSFLIDGVVGGSCSAAIPYLAEALDEYNGVCVRAAVSVDFGFYIAWFGMMLQIFMGIIMIRANGVALRDREDLLEQRPHKMWSWAEYFILRYMLEFGAEHHKPFLNPTSTILDKLILKGFLWLDNPKDTTKDIVDEVGEKSKEITCNALRCLCGCFKGVETVSLNVPVAANRPADGPSKWNTAQSLQTPSQPTPRGTATSARQHHHVTSGGGKWNTPAQVQAPKSRLPSTVANDYKAVVVKQPLHEATNPIFKREKAFSVDV